MISMLRACSAVALLAACSISVILCARAVSFAQDSQGKKNGGAKENPEKDLSTFMRKKLEASNQILEGLVTEDSGLIVKGAKQLIEMSSAEKFQVHNDVLYRQANTEFQKAAKSLVVSAEKENFDGVALKWFDTTMKCVECHKVARGLRLAGQGK